MTTQEARIGKVKQKDKLYIQEKLKNYVLDSTDLDWKDFFVARSQSKPIAFGRIIDHGDFFEIASLGVDYYHRKKGIGKKVLKFLAKKAKERSQRKPIYIVTDKPDFFNKVGFQEKDIYPAYLGYKKHCKCKSHASKIKIMKYQQTR